MCYFVINFPGNMATKDKNSMLSYVKHGIVWTLFTTADTALFFFYFDSVNMTMFLL